MTACEERYFGGEQNVSTIQSTFTTIYNQETLARNDSANCPLCCSLLFPFQQACLTLRLLHVVLVVQVVFPMSARRLSSDWQLFQKMLPQKLFFVVSLSAGCLSHHRLLYVVLVVQVVFPMSARRLSSDWQLFLKMLPAKVVLCCFPFSRLVSRIACCPGEA